MIIEKIIKNMMLKKLLFAVVLFSYTIQSQTYVKGTLDPAQNYSWVVLYQLKGAKQLYIKNETISNGKFSIEFPQNAPKGMYRLLYSQQNNGFIDFIYNNKSVELKFNPKNPLNTLTFLTSEENKIYQNYQIESTKNKHKLDSIQLSFFNTKDEVQRENLKNSYAKTYKIYNEKQKYYEILTKGKLSNHFIKSSFKYYVPHIIQTPQEYLNSEKQHYFDYVDFKDKVLLNSVFLSEKVTDYVFYLNGSDDMEVQNKLYKNAINEVFKKVGDNLLLKKELLITLMYNFSQLENTVLIDYLINNFYNKLPVELKDETAINQIQEKVKLAIGKIAPDFSFEKNGKKIALSELNKAEKYILVFWSTGCSHCLNEIPKLYDYTKNKTTVHVVAFAMENDDTDFNKYNSMFTAWTNILGLKKWQNPIAREYQITSTPTYFILDKDKKIIAKPEYFEDVKAFFEK